MNAVLRLSGCLLIAASLVACNQSGSPEPAAEVAAPERSDVPAVEGTSADAAIESDVTLTMPRVRTYVQAVKNLRAIGVEDIARGDRETQAEFEARLSATEASAAIGQAGMSVSEFANVGDLFLGAVTAQQLIDAGQLPAPPAGLEGAVDFVRQNQSEIDALMASVKDVDD